ncbi:MAG TPA: BON domain-containing protein [Candidatus Cybelea sp.]|nr:BON domain-containing protein [Candidatus Cybelea sp.]
MAVGAGSTAAVTALQERSVEDAVRDARIKVDVNSVLLQKDEKLFIKTSIDVVEGRVMLTGIMQTEQAKAEAERLTWQVEGVKQVYNELQISDSQGVIDYARDTRISAELRAGMISDKAISDINYTIEAVDGSIYLIGIARSQSELERVIGHARVIPGVKRVVNHVVLKDDPIRQKS